MRNLLSTAGQVARKEFLSFFASPTAYLFLGAFMAATLFVFFWVDAFFARNIADVRPLFRWLPLLLIFLVAALTMRAWSEERRAGTLESLLTAPVTPVTLVLGKFVAVLALVALALLLTLPLPVTVALMGPLDWGPVVGGYIATLFLAAAYTAIGLYMSVRTDNPIVALILTTLVCSLFYLIGSDTLTTLFSHEVASVLAGLGTGTRFDSILRGVLDLRDLYYYVSIVGVFLSLNLLSLERLRWAGNTSSARHRQWYWVTGLTAANFIAANLWLAPVNSARADITAGQIHSLSEATTRQLTNLSEPLLIRGYFSAKTHPLLAPLVPELKDLLEEYAVAAGGHARVEFVDPTRDRDAEEQAAARYGVRPVPFQTADRYQSSVVSAYFDIVVAYGDQYEKLGYRDLIEVKARGEGDLEVVLKNPEYAITRAIRKVSAAWRASGNPFDNLAHPVTFKGYVSPDDKLPEALRTLLTDLHTLLDDYVRQADGKFQVRFQDPDADGGALANELADTYGFAPQIASLVDTEPFWFYMVIESNGEAVQVPLPDTFSKEALKRSLGAALARFTSGTLKTVALVTPPAYTPGSPRYSQLEQVLAENVRVRETDLMDGQVPAETDLLLVLAPRELEDKQLFAIDQFLMQGGSVALASSPFDIEVSGTLGARKQRSGLEDWLAYHGITIGESFVLDPRNAALPIPMERQVGGLTLLEYHMLPYPHFPDLRGDSLNPDHPVTATLEQLTLNWVSPVTVDEEKNSQRAVTTLLRSSARSWASNSLNLIPDYRAYPDTGFASAGQRQSHVLAVALQGRFDSFYQGKSSPLASSGEETPDESAQGDTADLSPVITGIIDHSPDSARLILVASNSFASDAALELASQGLNTLYTKPLDFLQNVIDWSLEDPDLLALRGRTQLARTLYPMSERTQQLWESLNYALAVLGLIAVWTWRRWVAAANRRHSDRILAEV